jgi:hypothetical protein
MSVVANKPSPQGLLASFLQALDQTIANVALPRMGREHP